MADPTYRAAQPGEFFCPAGGKCCETKSSSSVSRKHSSDALSLRPAGRSTALDNQSPGGSCGGQTPFWTCAQAPSFYGCCNEDPCLNNSTCPEGKLEPAFWDRPDQYEYFKDLNILLSSTAPRSTSSPTPTTSSKPSSGSKVSGAVIGGAVGGSLAFIAIITAVVFLLCRRKRRNREQRSRSSSGGPMEENKPEAGELASPLSAAPPTYSWDANGNSPVQQRWVHNHASGHELPGEDSRDPHRSPYSELHSKSSLARIAELPGGTGVKELDTPEITPKPSHKEFENDMVKREYGLGLNTTQKESGEITGKR
ncbi:hypothetical protein ST47_g5344 [Ascochyta rabiei]|uniref:Uncharacterized protein n=1 Tax=Didymella rabiei TaxID=5454 RepID=A0A163E2G9_DIDRA|nr:hypothetical protein ST47_g5344 [Ascochyta rabiei]